MNTSVVSLVPRCLHEEVSLWTQCSSSDDGEATPSRGVCVCVCVQEAPLHRGDPHFRPKEITKPQQVRQMVEHYLETLRRKFGFNTITKVVYLPGVSETSIDSTHWHSICGWPYGLAD